MSDQWDPAKLQQLGALLQGVWSQAPKSHFPPPGITSPALLRQARFNAEIANLAEKARTEPAQLEQVIARLLEQNQLLLVAQSRPEVMDVCESVKALQGVTGGAADPTMLALLLATQSNSTTSQPPRKRPFPSRESDAGRSDSLPQSSSRWNRSSSPRRGTSRDGRCYKCGGTGHFGRECRER